jgi:tRNA(Ile)-lysidine synthase
MLQASGVVPVRDNRNVIDRVAATIEGYRMLARGRRVGVALSGGADSTFLLNALHQLGLATAILHVNHHLRNAESDADETFVRDLAFRFNLRLYLRDYPIAAGNIEQEARRTRYDFFAAQVAAGNCDVVATGHNLDDQAETVLYRFIRGAGTAGLAGILPVTENGIIRPLLGVRRDEIRAWLGEHNIVWREDRSNSNQDFARNRIRLQHMPELVASLNPALPEVLASTAAWARGEEDYWSAELDRVESLHLIRRSETVLPETVLPETVMIDTKPFLELPVALQRRLLRRGIARVRGSLRSIDFRHTEAIRAMMFTREGSGRLQLPDLDVYRSFDWLRLAPIGFDSRLERDFETPLAVPGRTDLAERLITIEMEFGRNPGVYNEVEQGLDWDRCAGPLVLRNWRPGDQYQRRGRSVAEKIKTLFQEFRIPLWERRSWPVIARSGSIVWTRRFGVAGEFAAGPESRNILMIREVSESNPVFQTSIEMSMGLAPVRVHSSEGSNESRRARDSEFPGLGDPGAEVS